jgi:GT2 family glycosyltransferase
VWVGVPSPEDLPADLGPLPVTVVHSAAGLTIQRNALIDAVGPGVDYLVFLDDDTELHPSFLAHAEKLVTRHPDVVLFSGLVVADGVRSAPIGRSTARALLEGRKPDDDIEEAAHVYGCCMVVRAETARAVRFDEALPLYGWLEDRDFSTRVARVGRVVNYAGCELVHLGVPSGRQSGVRLGYQQVVHPAYLRRRRVLSRSETLYLTLRPVLANLLGAAAPTRSAIDRRGRLRGNRIGVRSLLRGEPRPDEALRLP